MKALLQEAFQVLPEGSNGGVFVGWAGLIYLAFIARQVAAIRRSGVVAATHAVKSDSLFPRPSTRWCR